ncbi:hypothetical protein [Methylobacterium sp. WL103]|uniref:hypothetical protein n=1 Tax=Methylobacterium sp. WL103 TaxID=2603891 RepID=UPI001AEDF4AC|nr:hypothetical protein [Methylobacterium sp. WL103]
MQVVALDQATGIMPAEISFQSVRAVTQEGTEDSHLVFLDGALMALLVPAETGWFLQFSLGFREQEGVIFTTLAMAENWIRDRTSSVVAL